MHPHIPAKPGNPTEPEPLAQVNVGMQVVDSAGAEVGTVTDVQMSDTGPRPDVAAADADRLRHTGYFRVKTSGVFSHDAYVARDQVADVVEADGGLVTLNVAKDALVRE
jgi:hypothetical protein